GNVNGTLNYRHAGDEDFLTGELGARAFDGPLLAHFDVGGEGVVLDGRALARGLLAWADLPALESLVTGYFPYTARLDLEGSAPRLALESDLEGLAIHLPAPFGKEIGERVPLRVEATPGELVHVNVAQRLRMRWRSRDAETGQGQVWLQQWPSSPDWPAGPGWELAWQAPQLSIERWQEALAGLSLPRVAAGEDRESLSPPLLRRVRIETDCLQWEGRCLGSMQAGIVPLAEGWRATLDGSLVQGLAEYRPQQPTPLAITLSQLQLDPLLPEASGSAQATDPARAGESVSLLDQVATAPEPVALPAWLGKIPAGQLKVEALGYAGRTLGPLTAGWNASAQRLEVAPLSLAVGEIVAEGELAWERSGAEASLTRSRLALTGGDLGSLIEALGQPVPLRSESTRVQTQLAWPGAPWQFALERSRGSIEARLEDGRFLTLESPSARLVGLLNVDNLLRRLRLDFSDVTGQGTAFDSVTGSATLYDGRLETRGPVEIDGASTHFSLDGSVNLVAKQLDLLLGVTVPVSQNLPLAAVLVGAPYVGGALYLADKVFGGWIDKVTQIYYRVQGPWTSPQITLENAE
ncbi:MAG: AsmA-like C-terminal region-containing protein, partial [Halomonas sp.]|nr:AsmA-like C-terminal region-containing protein [Halomonas sp.]